MNFFIACFLMIGVSHAGNLSYNSQLSIKLWENTSYTIMLDNQSYQSTSRFKANNVAPGRHRVRIVRNNSYGSCGWTGQQLVYDGAVQIPARSIVKTKLAGNSLRIVNVERIPMPAGFCSHGHQMGHCGYGCGAPPINNCSHGHQMGHCGYGCGAPPVSSASHINCNHGSPFGQCVYGCQMPAGYCMHGDPYASCSFGCQNPNAGNCGNGGFGNSNGNNGNPYGDPYGNPYGNGNGNWGNGNGSGYGDPFGNGSGDETVVFMSDEDFKHLKNTMKNEAFDNRKLMVAQQAMNRNRVSSKQVSELMGLMSFESNRLKLAKTAYPSVADKKNFFRVNKSLSFNSSKKDLDQFVKSRP
jgi:hypothetical protein